MTSYERTGWRDERISRRHRRWGCACPAVDLDFLLVEYNFGGPVALIEYKAVGAQTPNTMHPTYRALTLLADGYKHGSLPFLIAFYWPDVWAFRIHPVNLCAKEHFRDAEILTERQFVDRLYGLRDLVISDYLSRRLNNQLPLEIA